MFSPSNKITAKDIEELYYISDIDNVPSILDKGILSHNDVKDIPHKDISNKDIQALRKDKLVSIDASHTQLSLWSFVCLFAQPHNAMMHVSKGKNICVLRIDKKILEQQGVLISDRNASCYNAIFTNVEKWALTDETARCLYSRYSLPHNNNLISTNDYKSIRQLEVLCPIRVAKEFILGFFVKQHEDMQALLAMVKETFSPSTISVNSNIFFLGKSLKLKTFTPLNQKAIDINTYDNKASDENSESENILEEFKHVSI